MYISKFRVENYKSYLSSPELSLTPGFNLVTGQNNAGKTALLEAMALQFTAKSHRSVRTVPNPVSQPNPMSFVEVSFTLSREELLDILLVPNGGFGLPPLTLGTEFAQ
jgi:recombinational DNA repair ATPase RecF